MEPSRVPDDRQRRFPTIDASPSLRYRLNIRWKPLLLPISVPIGPRLIQRHDVLPILTLDGLQNGQKFLCSLESGHVFNASKSVRDPPKMFQPPPHAVRQMTVDSGPRHHHPLQDLTERKKRCLCKHNRNPIGKSQIPFKSPEDKGIFIFRSVYEFSDICSSWRISNCILFEHAVDFMPDHMFGHLALWKKAKRECRPII
jgi:hypothetical protein